MMRPQYSFPDFQNKIKVLEQMFIQKYQCTDKQEFYQIIIY
ncbi:unnamed protein product [Paramecium sonneborni]|uniref:Uncharacterized protein n=1 Tax=Paramecium sonneborni TaxID=65129 RepID=A0A8S1MC56_9CILI|nr:unnamed protein product [Paramecium sonneborni]